MTSVTGTGEDVINRQLNLRLSELSSECSFVTEDLIRRCSNWISVNGYQHVGLQFPDFFLSRTAAFYSSLKQQLPESVSLYVLADSSFAPCCADVVTAEHTTCDSLIHFGHACLTQLDSSEALSCLNIFIPPEIDLADLKSQIAVVSTLSNGLSELLLLYDVVFSDRIDEIAREIATVFNGKLVVSRTRKQTSENHDSEQGSLCQLKYGRLIPADTKLESGKFSVLYISSTSRSKARLLFQLNYWKRVSQFLVYQVDSKQLRIDSSNVVENAESASTVSKIEYKQFDETLSFLKRRYVVVQKIREAKTIGLLVGSLHLAGATKLLDSLRRLVRLSGRRAYTFAVGRLNIPKLANYLEVDTFCLVSCVESSLFDDASFVREFHAPLCSPFELLVALQAPSTESVAALFFDPLSTTTTTTTTTTDEDQDVLYTTDIADLLPESRFCKSLLRRLGSSEKSEAELSLVSGTLHRVANAEPNISSTSASQPAYDRQNDKRTYFGMPVDAGTEVDEMDEAMDQLGVLEGRSGIASRYTDDVLTLSRTTTRITTPRSGSVRSSFSEN